MRHGPAYAAAITATVVAVDQAAKYAVRTNLAPAGTSVPVIGDLLRLTFTRNTGAAFGMLAGGRIAFIAVSLTAVLVIAGYLVRRRPERAWLIIALGLVAGGAIGNLIDRAFIGWVTDFIQIPFSFPVFNVADSSVVVGVAMLVWWLLFGPESAPEPMAESAPEPAPKPAHESPIAPADATPAECETAPPSTEDAS